nr:2-C-methyl-D-erythritol 4-phosphate cytidylyltransferase [Syntrophobotulus glycolicus]
MDKTGAVIPAAGQGKRMGGEGNKLFLEIAGTPVLVYTLRVFQKARSIAEIVIVAARDEIVLIEELVKKYELDKVVGVVEGGAQRQQSVKAGIQALSPEINRVVIHDGARPLLKIKELDHFLYNAQGYDAAIMAVPLKDTVKIVNEENTVLETPSREKLRAVQTPQVFCRSLLETAHREAETKIFLGTDDASLIEWMGQPVKVLDGTYENIKVTTPEDMLLAETILRRYRKDEMGCE